MAVTVTDNRTVWSEADSTTGWTGTTLTLVTSDPDPVESTGHLGNVVSTATVDCYFTGSSTSMTGKLLYAWALPLGAMDTLTNGGVAILLGDGTNRVGYHLAGSDTAVFRHNSGQPAYQCLLLDQSNLPANTTTRAGAAGSLNFGAITQMGVMFKTLAKSKGGVANCFVDAVRILDPTANNGCALTISGGTSGDPGTFTQIAADDSSTADAKAYGVARLLGAGAIGLQGPLRFGDTASGSSWFEDKNVTVVFEDRGLAASRYKIFITDNGTGTTTFRLGTKVGSGITATGADGVTITGGSGVNWQFDASTDTDVTDVFIYGSTFNRATQGISFRSGHEFIGGTISASGAITLNGATFVNNTVTGSTVAADASAVMWDVASDPDTFLNGTSITKGTNAHHAIEFGTSSPTTMTLRDMNFTSFTNTIGDNAAPLYIRRTTGTVTINLINCTGVTANGYKTSGADVVININPVTTLINIKDPDGNNEQNVRVYMQAADATGDLPFEESVTISRASGGLATVTHTNHGMNSNEYIKFSGITNAEEDLSGAFQITVVNANTYTYTSNGTTSLSYTGSIVATGVTIYGLTDASGNISSSRTYSTNQPLTGYARKSDDGVTYFKPIDLVDTVSNTTGLTINRRLVSDGSV